jgi:hypothetical protein
MIRPMRNSRDADARIGGDNIYFKGAREMNIRFSRWATGLVAIAAVVVMAGQSWAVYYELPPSKDEYGLKYHVDLNANDDKMSVVFTLADEGRLKSIYSATVIALSKPDSSGGRTHELSAAIELKTTSDGKRAGQVQIGKEFVDRAYIRVLTLNLDGLRRPNNAAVYYVIPLKKFLNKAPATASTQSPATIAAPPTPKVTK